MEEVVDEEHRVGQIGEREAGVVLGELVMYLSRRDWSENYDAHEADIRIADMRMSDMNEANNGSSDSIETGATMVHGHGDAQQAQIAHLLEQRPIQTALRDREHISD